MKRLCLIVLALLTIPNFTHAQQFDTSQTVVTATGGSTAKSMLDWFVNVPNGIGNAAGYNIGTAGATIPLMSSLAPSATIDTTNANNIVSGNLSVLRLNSGTM